MKRKWQMLMALVLSLVTIITVAVPVLAQDEEPADAESSSRGALAIIAPWSVPVGREFTVRAFLRENQEVFSGAGVWAVSTDSIETLKEALKQLKEDSNQTDVGRDYEGILDAHGNFLGRTGGDGRLACTFDQAGKYVLVAARNGYLPGFTRIGIRETINALGIKATPQRTIVGKEVTLNVFDRRSHDPVDAGVWALSRDKAAALREEIAALREDTSTSAAEKDYEAVVSLHGDFLGRTGPDGELTVTFDEAGGYLLVTAKKGYIPGFTALVVREMPQPKTVEPERQANPGLSGTGQAQLR